MPQLIEPLESRTLLSATPLFFTQVKVVETDAKAVLSVDAGGLKAIKACNAERNSFRTLARGNAAAVKTLFKELAAINKLLTSDLKKLVADDAALARRPADETLLVASSDVKAALSTSASNALTAITNDINVLQTADDTNSSIVDTVGRGPAGLPTVLDTAVADYQTSLAKSLKTLKSAVTVELKKDLTSQA